MKKIILLLLLIPLLFSFKYNSDSNKQINNDSMLFKKYEFTITVNGEIHKIKGNVFSGVPTGNGYFPGNPSQRVTSNKCIATNFGIDKTVYLEINDVTGQNYESGQNIQCNILLPNLLLGLNDAKVDFTGSYFDNLSKSLGSNNFKYQTINGSPDNTKSNKLPISITDLGKAPTIDNLKFYSFGETLKGNYSGTIYLKNNTNGNFTIPVQISIDFKALRMY